MLTFLHYAPPIAQSLVIDAVLLDLEDLALKLRYSSSNDSWHLRTGARTHTLTWSIFQEKSINFSFLVAYFRHKKIYHHRHVNILDGTVNFALLSLFYAI